jgi:hypothetical protein
MTAKKTPKVAARPARAGEKVEQGACDYIRAKNDTRLRKREYRQKCGSYKESHGGTHVSTDDPKFRRATKKAYVAHQEACIAERNALRRLETAVRNCPASAPNNPAKALEATQPKGTLPDNLAIVEAYVRMLGISANERLALVRKVAALHGVDLGDLLGVKQRGE